MVTRVRGKINTRAIYIELTEKGKIAYKAASLKVESNCNDLYRNIDEKNLTSQLLLLSNELNKLNKINN